LLISAVLLLHPSPSDAKDEPRPADLSLRATPSEIWVPAFREWTDHRLTLEQLREARSELRPPDESETATLLGRLVREHIEQLRASMALPGYAVPPINARGITGETLEAARMYAQGKIDEALQRLRAPHIRGEPMGAHVRVQILDERTHEAHPRERLDVIESYRAALRAGPDAAPAHRARLRIGQIYLDIGFVAEARAALRELADVELPPELEERLRISLAEAAFRAGDVEQALEELERLDLERIPADARRWAHHRRGDVLLALHRYPPAADEYRMAVELSPPDSPPETTLRLRLAHSELESGYAARAESSLERIPQTSSETHVLAALLRSNARRELGDLQGSIKEALRILEGSPPPDFAAMAGVAVLVGERLRGRESTVIPPGSSKLIRSNPATQSVGLLAYEIAKTPVPGENAAQTRRRIAEVLRRIPEGSVSTLVGRDLAYRIGEHFVGFLLRGAQLDATFLEDLDRYLYPPRVPEELVLLALETSFRIGDRRRCTGWARTLQSREVRPIRRGLALWREAHCMGRFLPDRISGDVLIQVADTGETGAFSLPLITLAAEGRIHEGDAEGGVEIYGRALETFGTPDLLAPVLIRMGELKGAMGQLSDATRPVVRGLALLDPAYASARGFRAVGLVTLLRLASRVEVTPAVRTSVQQALAAASPEWRGALQYLASRVDLADPPSGEGIFARATLQMRETDRLAVRLREKTRATGLSAVGGKR
jgi:tetratricopeptide (TPR) repeat protein